MKTLEPAVEWRDLVALSIREKVCELILPLPWLVLSLLCYAQDNGWVAAGVFCSVYLFLTGLRQSHGAQHYSLGLPRRAQDAVLFALSVVMLGSMHAVQVSHLHHHRHCMEEDDSEGATARLRWWQAIISGPLFIIRLHRCAWRRGSGEKRLWILAELCAAAAMAAAAVACHSAALRWHVLAMVAGECLAGFFAVWTVHHDCAPGKYPARTQRGRWLNRLCYSMFYHAEHHLFPAVPTCHLRILADRLDLAGSWKVAEVITLFNRAPRHA